MLGNIELYQAIHQLNLQTQDFFSGTYDSDLNISESIAPAEMLPFSGNLKDLIDPDDLNHLMSRMKNDEMNTCVAIIRIKTIEEPLLWLGFSKPSGWGYFISHICSFNNIRNLFFNQIRLPILYDQNPDILFTVRVDGTFFNINRHGMSLFGFDRDTELSGAKLDDYLLNPQSMNLIISQIRQKGIIKEMEICLKSPVHEKIFGIASILPLMDQKERIISLTFFIKDISDRINIMGNYMKASLDLIESNQTLKKTQTTLFQQEKLASVGQLAAGLAHEINNPLSYVINNVNVMFRYLDSMERFVRQVRKTYGAKREEYEYLISEIQSLDEKLDLPFMFSDNKDLRLETEEGIGKIKNLLTSLKQFARQDSMKSREYYNINKALETTLTITKNEYKYNIDIIRKWGEIPEILCDPLQLNQVFLNILMNAIEAIKSEKKKVNGKIQIETDKDDDYIWIIFQDDGPGIPENLINQVMEPFFTTKPVGKGTGLGLSMANDIIVNKHGGILKIETLEKGTRVLIALPIINDL